MKKSELTATEQVINTIQAGIKKGSFKIGQRLPSQRSMTKLFGVSRTVVREAIKILEGKGLVKSKRGSGIFICNPPIGSTQNNGTDSFKNISLSLEEILSFARGIYSLVCIQAIKNASDDELKMLSLQSKEFLKNYSKSTTIQEKYIHETSFGTNIGRFSHNPISYEIVLGLLKTTSEIDYVVVSDHTLYRQILMIDINLTDALVERNAERVMLWGKERDKIITQIIESKSFPLNNSFNCNFHFSFNEI